VFALLFCAPVLAAPGGVVELTAPLPTKQQLSELGSLYAEVQRHRAGGRWPEAIEAQRRLIARVRDHLGTKHLHYARLWGELTVMLHVHGKPGEASTALDETVRVYESLLGPRNTEFASVLNGLAGELRPRSRREIQVPGGFTAVRPEGRGAHAEDRIGAVGLYERALAIRKEVRGVRHADTAESMINLAALLMLLGDDDRPGPLFEQGLEILERVRGEADLVYSRGLLNLGVWRKSRGEFEEARALYQRALDATRQRLGDRHLECVTALYNLGMLAEHLGRGTEALAYFSRSEAVRQAAERTNVEGLRVHGRYHQLRADGGGPEAVAAARAMVGLFEQPAPATMHPNYAHSLADLGEALARTGDNAGARRAFERAAAVARVAYGVRDPWCQRHLTRLARFLAETGDQAGARRALEKALEELRNGPGEHHQDYAETLDALGRLLLDQGDYVGAHDTYEKALAVCGETNGYWHLAYAKGLNNLATVWAALEQWSRARPLFERTLAVMELHSEHRGPLRGYRSARPRGTVLPEGPVHLGSGFRARRPREPRPSLQPRSQPAHPGRPPGGPPVR
jgi:tetratricopeptide (TPR) repeat protein